MRICAYVRIFERKARYIVTTHRSPIKTILITSSTCRFWQQRLYTHSSAKAISNYHSWDLQHFEFAFRVRLNRWRNGLVIGCTPHWKGKSQIKIYSYMEFSRAQHMTYVHHSICVYYCTYKRRLIKMLSQRHTETPNETKNKCNRVHGQPDYRTHVTHTHTHPRTHTAEKYWQTSRVIYTHCARM